MYQKLLQTASALNRELPGPVTQEFSQKRDELAALGNQAMAERPDLDKLVGRENRPMAEDNNRNFARFMESMLLEFDPEVLVETVLWVFRSYRAHGFQPVYWAANLNTWVGHLKQELSKETYDAIYPYFNWLIVNIPVFVKLTDADLEGRSVE